MVEEAEMKKMGTSAPSGLTLTWGLAGYSGEDAHDCVCLT